MKNNNNNVILLGLINSNKSTLLDNTKYSIEKTLKVLYFTYFKYFLNFIISLKQSNNK